MVYNIDFKKIKFNKSFGLVFLCMGLLFFIIFGSISIGGIIKKNSLDASVKATNVEWKESYDREDNSVTYSPIYYYEVDNKQYICDSNVYSNVQKSSGIVYYDSNNPAKCMSDFESNSNWIFLVFLLIPIIFIGVGATFIKSYMKKQKNLKKLATTGVLVKGIPYQIIDSNTSVNGRRLKCFSIMFTFPNGTTKNIVSDPAYNHVLSDYDGKCDLLYDPNNYDNYFIDLEITTTGSGNPNIVYFEQTQQFNNNFDYNSSYNPENKF